jgi:MtrB/PioB family decaheme-associated outer membrane protein
MKTRIAFSLVAALCLVGLPAAGAAGEPQSGGSITLDFRGVGGDDESAKAQEYRDLSDGVAASADLFYVNGAYHLEILGSDLGLDDQSVRLRGGDYGNFKYTIFYDQIPHEYSSGARSFYTGIGTGDLDYSAAARAKNLDARLTPAISTDPNLWNVFDYGIQRKSYGASGEASLKSPFYLRLGAMQEDRTGTKPLGADSGVFADVTGSQTSSFGNVVEMPEPVDYQTRTATIEAGYRTRPVVLILKGLWSSFDNDIETLSWRNPYVTTERLIETNYLPPDNDYWKVDAQGIFRLPARSTLALRVNYARLKNDLDLGTTVTDSVAANPSNGISTGTSPRYFLTTLGLNRSGFKGDIAYTNARVAYDTSALMPVTLGVIYDYTGKDNESSRVEYTNPITGDTQVSELFEYHQNHAGVSLGMKLPWESQLNVGYDYRTVDRTLREDAEKTDEHDVSVRLRHVASDLLTGRVKYQHVFRSSEYAIEASDFRAGDAASIELYERRFDVADRDRDVAGIGFSLTPTERLDLDLEYTYTRDDYDTTILGLLEETGHEAYLDLSYRLPRDIVVGASGGYERVVSDQRQRQYNPGNNTNPDSPNTATAFNWTESLRSDNWSCGLSARIPLVKEKLDLAAAWNFLESDGEGIFASTARALENLDASNDYTKDTLEIEAVYRVFAQLAVTLGYRHERLDYRDDQWSGYKYAGTNTLLTGAYADEEYDLDIGYLTMKFTF